MLWLRTFLVSVRIQCRWRNGLEPRWHSGSRGPLLGEVKEEDVPREDGEHRQAGVSRSVGVAQFWRHGQSKWSRPGHEVLVLAGARLDY
jgi:hypothetical protein